MSHYKNEEQLKQQIIEVFGNRDGKKKDLSPAQIAEIADAIQTFLDVNKDVIFGEWFEEYTKMFVTAKDVKVDEKVT